MKIHKFSAILATTVVAVGSGMGIAQAQTSGDTSKSSTSTTQGAGAQKGKRGGPGRGMRAGDLKALASKLGVSVAKLQAAMDATRPAKSTTGAKRGPGDMAAHEAAHEAEHEARHAAMAAALAKELGLSTEKVQAALESTRPARPAGR